MNEQPEHQSSLASYKFGKQDSLLMPKSNSFRYPKQKKTEEEEKEQVWGTPSNKKKGSSFEITGTTAGSRRSSFSKKSNSRGKSGICCDDSSDNFGNAAASVSKYDMKETFVSRFRDDFDRLKFYEDTAIKIYNEISLSKITHPKDSEQFSAVFKNNTPHSQTLFLDLDDTLSCVSLYKLGNENFQEVIINEQDGKTMKMYLYVRPGLQNFLDRVSEKFELVLFNNGSQTFTQSVYQQILQSFTNTTNGDYFSYILSKDQCSINDGGQEIKNLEFFCGSESNRDIKRSIIVDNNIYSFQKHLTNGLQIPKYEGQQEDNWLELLGDYLIESFCNQILNQSIDSPSHKSIDFRKVISQDFCFDRIIENTRTSYIRQQMTKKISVQKFEEEEDDQLKEGGQEEAKWTGKSQSKDSEGSPISLSSRSKNINELINKPISKMSEKTYRDCYLSFVKD
ncbi:nli interacting factor-like phosphatase family protein [Stylonychia lemnae]|uniref:Mitochondrial import inner membrane translocase subunit TIM50 n=1 Tax=Stylonychia lemnae TaxID=5949 RepID=A0A078A8Y4_STYLE|nr:nli interacting factor-like phosphatase family protein [Stylonychia lemnae]|eukprot:CDW78735.1 nli interacting factor-like phosphatase family protein [Stylonychia lemnae]